jgi:hypothetical protein
MAALSTSHPLVWIDCEVRAAQLCQNAELNLTMRR